MNHASAFPRRVRVVQIGVGEVRPIRPVGIPVAVEELFVASGASRPFPLRFCRKFHFLIELLGHPLAELRRFLPGDSGNGLKRMVGDISGRGVIFAVFAMIASVVFRVETFVLLVCNFRFRHPERLFNFHHSAGAFIRIPFLRPHNVLARRDFHKRHIDVVASMVFSNAERLPFLIFPARQFCGGSSAHGPVFHRQFVRLNERLRRRNNRLDIGFSSGERLTIFLFRVVVYAGIELLQFQTSILSAGVVPHAGIRRVEVNPRIEPFPRFLRQLNAVMSFFKHLNQFACRGVIFHRLHHVEVVFRTRTPDVRVDRGVRRIVDPIPGVVRNERQAAGFVVVVMTSNAVLVQSGLEFRLEPPGSSRTVPRRKFLRGFAGRNRHFGRRNVVGVFVTAVAGQGFARHDNRPGSHQRDCRAFFVQNLHRKRRVGRNFKEERPVVFNFHCTQNAFNIPRRLLTAGFVPAGMVVSVMIGDNANALCASSGDAFHASTKINVCTEDSTSLFVHVNVIRNYRRDRLRQNRVRFEKVASVAMRQKNHVVENVNEVNAENIVIPFADQKVFVRQRERMSKPVRRSARDVVTDIADHVAPVAGQFLNAAGNFRRENVRDKVEERSAFSPFLVFRTESHRVVSPFIRIDEQQTPHFRHGVMSADNADKLCAVAGTLFGMFISVGEIASRSPQRALIASVRVHRKDVSGEVVRHVGVFPTQVHNLTVVHDSRMPVRVLLESELTGFFGFRINAVQVDHDAPAVFARQSLNSRR